MCGIAGIVEGGAGQQAAMARMLEALRHHLCRCGAHVEIMRAAMRAAGRAVEAQTS